MCQLTEASLHNPICCQRSVCIVLPRRPLKVIGAFLSWKYFAYGYIQINVDLAVK